MPWKSCAESSVPASERIWFRPLQAHISWDMDHDEERSRMGHPGNDMTQGRCRDRRADDFLFISARNINGADDAF